MSFRDLTAHFFLALRNITLSGWAIVYPSPTEGHLGCFCVLVIMNEAAVNHIPQALNRVFNSPVRHRVGGCVCVPMRV